LLVSIKITEFQGLHP